MSVHKVRYLRYACSQNGHLLNVNSHFSNYASLDSELSESDTELIVRLKLIHIHMLIKISILIQFVFIFSIVNAQKMNDYPITPVSFTKVKINDNFWKPRLETNRKVTIPYDFQKCEETDRIQNFEIAAGMKKGKFSGIRFNDSDVFKIMEGAAYSLANHPDPDLEKYLDDLIAKIAGAQEDDGYLYTARTIDPDHPARDAGKERWSYLDQSHELYNVGHMYEAAVAHFQATEKRTFLNVAIKNANLIADTFGPNKQYGVPGHQEIEIGLVKLYRVTSDEKYLNLAKYFLDIRGQQVENVLYPQRHDIYLQSHIPVVEQSEAVGHSVRATYMYSGMADVAAIVGDENYIKAIDKIWENVVHKKIYVTGGIGARHRGEAFGDDYELPNKTAYNETCAAIANCMWNHRMFLLKGNAGYYDVLERTLYNGLLSGISIEGDKFFYPNPLACDANYSFNQGALTRKPWFDCSCCPANIVRFLPSLPGYIYATKDDNLFVNLYMSNEAEIEIAKQSVHIIQTSNYPWDGEISIEVIPEKTLKFNLKLRIPGWAQNQPLPGDLYNFIKKSDAGVIATLNAENIALEIENGYLTIENRWKKGDVVKLILPMDVRLVESSEKVIENRNRVAIERGPVVYCVEGVDNMGEVFNLLMPENTPTNTQWKGDLLGGINIIKAEVPSFAVVNNGAKVVTENHHLIAIPYYAWSHRGIGEMAVWLPIKVKKIEITAY